MLTLLALPILAADFPARLETLEDPSATVYGNFGSRLAGGADIDADGFADSLISDYGLNGSGGVYVYHGGSSGLGPDPSTLLLPINQADDAHFGMGLSTVRDIGGDAYDDAVIGDPMTELAYLYNGGPDGLTFALDIQPDAAVSGDSYFGWSVAGIDDADDDGFGDLVIGAPKDSGLHQESGSAWLYRTDGDTIGWPPTPLRPSDADAYDSFGVALATLGDIDGDGHDEIAITNEPSDEARTGVYLYNPTEESEFEEQTLRSPLASGEDSFGAAVTGCGDLNGDGHQDLAIGAPTHLETAGAVVVYYGSTTGFDASAFEAIAEPAGTPSGFGAALGGPADVNSDGLADLLVGAPYGDIGRVYLFPGAPGGVLSGTEPVSVTLGTSEDGFGILIGSAGDADADGAGDILLLFRPHNQANLVYAAYGVSGAEAKDTDTGNDGDDMECGCSSLGLAPSQPALASVLFALSWTFSRRRSVVTRSHRKIRR